LALCPPIDIPLGWTGSVIYEQPGKVCPNCPKLHKAILAAGYHIAAPGDDTDAPYLSVVLQGATDEEVEQLFIQRNITLTPTVVDFENGKEVTRTVGYLGTDAEVQAILIKNPVIRPAIRQRMIRDNSRQRSSRSSEVPPTKSRSKIEYAVDQVPEDEESQSELYRKALAAADEADRTGGWKSYYATPVKSSSPQYQKVSEIDFSAYPDGTKIKTYDCGNPEHPQIGTVTVRNGNPIREDGSNCLSPMTTYSTTVPYSNRMTVTLPTDPPVQYDAPPQQGYPVTVVDCGRPDHPVIGSYQTPVMTQNYQPSYSSSNYSSPNYSQGYPQQNYGNGYSQQVVPMNYQSYAPPVNIQSYGQYYGGGFSGGCPPGGCPPRYGY
jgi:hypothetical protein